MANKNRIRRIEFKFGDVIRRNNRATAKAFKKVAAQMQKAVRASIDTPWPPASTPGNPPHKRTGKLQRHTTVKAEGKKIVVRTVQYGVWLEGGTRNMAMRPFLIPELKGNRNEWRRKLNAELRKNTK